MSVVYPHHNLLSKMNCAFYKNALNCKPKFYVSLIWCFYYQSSFRVYIVLPEVVWGVFRLHILIHTERSKSNACVTKKWIMQQQPVLRQSKITFFFLFLITFCITSKELQRRLCKHQQTLTRLFDCFIKNKMHVWSWNVRIRHQIVVLIS